MMVHMDSEFYGANERDLKTLVAVTIDPRDPVPKHWELLTPEGKRALKQYIESLQDSAISCWSAEAEAGVLDTCGVDIRKLRWIDGMVMWKLKWGGQESWKVRNSLLDAAGWYNIPYTENKDLNRDIILRGRGHLHMTEITRYCEEDTLVLRQVMQRLMPDLINDPYTNLTMAAYERLSRYSALLYLVAKEGIPIDHERLLQIRDKREYLIDNMWLALCKDHYAFVKKVAGEWIQSMSRFSRYLRDKGYDEWWPTTSTGNPATDRDNLKSLGDEAIREYVSSRSAIKQLQDMSEARTVFWNEKYGSDHRQRSYLGPFRTLTGRNAPPERTFVLAQASFLRCIIRAPWDEIIIGMDFEGQEFGVAASLSHDDNMMEAYRSGDPYSWWAVKAGQIPEILPDGTPALSKIESLKDLYPNVRSLFKIICLGLLYNMGATTLSRHVSQQLGVKMTPREATAYIALFRSTYPRYDEMRLYAHTAWKKVKYGDTSIKRRVLCDGWSMVIDRMTKLGTVINFPIQGTGGVILRLALMACLDGGIRVIAPLHDAIYAICKKTEAEDVKRRMHKIMMDSARDLLVAAGGADLQIRVEIKEYPPEKDWVEKKGKRYYELFSKLLDWRK